MATTNQERVGKAMDLLRQGLAPFVEREVQEKVRGGAVLLAVENAPNSCLAADAHQNSTVY